VIIDRYNIALYLDDVTGWQMVITSATDPSLQVVTNRPQVTGKLRQLATLLDAPK
jgi:hypothetical protein